MDDPTRTLPPLSEPGFAASVAAHAPVMTRLAGRLVRPVDRDDLVQDALLLAWRRRATFDPARGSLQVWLLTLVADQARKRHRRRPPDPVELVPHGVHTDRPADVDLERAVAALPRRQRLAVALFYFCDLPVADVAAAMGCAEGTAKATLAHARRTLAATLTPSATSGDTAS